MLINNNIFQNIEKYEKKIALIFGITGQDGAYLSELLLKKNYVVNGVIRRSSSFNTGRIDHLYQDPMKKIETLFCIMET